MADLESLLADVPIALLPVRLETRFVDDELRVRIYPDEIVADLHQPEVTKVERDAALAFWTEAWDPAAELDAWTRLVAHRTPQRAAWLVHAFEPANVDERPAGAPVFPVVDERDVRLPAAAARVLPARWTVLAYRGGAEIVRAESHALVWPLAMSYAPDVADGSPDLVMYDELALDRDLAWTIDWKAAVEVGMGVVLPLTEADRELGFDRVIAVGVRTEREARDAADELAALLDAHHYTRGLALVRQGTPTNNTGDAPAGYPPPDDAARSHAIERGASAIAPGTDGAVLAAALGVPAAVFAHVEGCAGREQLRARAMNAALWPCTLGYFLEQLMAPTLSRDDIARTRGLFTEFVRGRGPLPAFRVGRVPYGVLPVTSVERWVEPASAPAFDRQLVALLRSWRAAWLAAGAQVARVSPPTGAGLASSSDPDADLLGVLAVDASAREVRTREVLGPAVVDNLYRLFGHDPAVDHEPRRALTQAVLSAAGLTGLEPRLAQLTWDDAAHRIGRPLVAPGPLSEEAPLAPNYLHALRTAGDIGWLRFAVRREGEYEKAPLLCHLIRQGALVEYARLGVELAIANGLATEVDAIEAELLQVAPGTLTRATTWDRFDARIPAATGPLVLGAWLLADSGTHATQAAAQAWRAAVAELETAPTAELERLLTETLDTCSHRLDAWLTSLATRRLAELRSKQPTGCYVGAFGWVEGVRPRREPRAGTQGGFIHAPSPVHAATAAVLRNAHLTRTGAARDQVAVDLSSARVRRGLELLDGVREGQPAGAVLGYRFERALHDAGRDVYIAPFRRLYPLGGVPGAPPSAPSERIAARDVVDGLALHTAIGTATPPWNDPLVLPPVAVADRGAVSAALAVLLGDVDAATDLLVAESVHQAVQGSSDRAEATLAAVAGRGLAPSPQVAAVPRAGTGSTHRVALALGPPPPGGVPGWTADAPRRAGEPRLDAWVATRLGAPADVRARVRAGDQVHEVSLAALQLAALDVLALAQRDAAAELDARIAWVAHTAHGLSGPVSVDHERDPAWPDAVATFPELLELARTLGALITAGRPLGAGDLAAAGRAVETAIDVGELAGRAAAARSRLADARGGLAAAIAGGAPDALRAALWTATGFGTAAPIGDDAAVVALAPAVVVELDRRAAAAAAASADPRAQLAAVFGPELVVLPTFAPPAPAELAAAIAYGPTLVGDPDAPRRWFAATAQVRAPLAALRLAGLATGGGEIALEVAQLPHDPTARWIGLAFDPADPDQQPRAGACSIALHRPFALPAGAAWAGLLVDEWADLIPSPTQLTAYAVHHDAPGAEAAQCVLLAVPTPDMKYWDLDALVAMIHETLDLAVVRAVDSELLPFSMIAPTIYLAANLADDTVGFHATAHLIAEDRVLAPE